MAKICPNCQTKYDDNHGYCSNCGGRLIDDIDDTFNPILSIGDANAISGGVNIDRSKNITSHDTHYHSTTVHERSKSELEIRLDAANRLREKAEGIIAERGRIDSVAMSQLRPLASRLGIDDETFKSIIRDVRSNRSGASGLSVANARYLQQAQQAVQTNDMDALSNLTPRLEAMASISQDDNVQYLYYLTLSLFYPIKSMEVYEQQMDENYWRVFWAIISYVRSGKHAEATSLLAQFDPLRFEKSEDDQNLLEAYFNIMKSDKDEAQEFLDEILGEPTEQLKPLLRAIESTLYEEEPESLEARFYMERVMTKSDVVVKSAKPAAPKPAAETTPKEPKPEAKQKPQPAPMPEETPAPKGSKEADDLYAKAAVASGAKRVMLLQKAADAGSLDAMYDLSDCYWDGEGVDKNMPLAIKWATKAADAGHVRAQAALGAIYFQGMEGLDQNYALSEKYLLMAADKDHTEAQAFLAMLYVGMEEYDKAIVWARKAAQINQSLAELVLGRIYDEGLGVEVDHVEGLKWFEKAANNGNADAQNMVGNIYSDADYVKPDLPKAFKYYQMAAAQGHLWGMYNLACCYQGGIGVDVNPFSAEEWLQKAADGGLQEAVDLLKDSPFHLPPGLTPDFFGTTSKSLSNIFDFDGSKVKAYQRQADHKNYDAMVKLGLCYLTGSGVKQNDNIANMWIERVVELGNPDIAFTLGEMYATGGVDIEQNFALAAKWYREAANQNYPEAMFKLGVLYMTGNGVDANDIKARELIYEAAGLGCSEADWYIEAHHIPPLSAEEWGRKSTAEDPILEFFGTSTMALSDVFEFDGDMISIYKTQANDGDKNAMTKLGLCYLTGNGVKPSDSIADMWLKRAVELGDSHTAFMLGETYATGGIDIGQNFELAAKWYKEAADQYHPEAMFKLGLLYMTGNGVAANNEKAIGFMQGAANLGCSKAKKYIESHPEVKAYIEKHPELVREKMTQPEPNAIINEIWARSDGSNIMSVHVDFIVNNLRGKRVVVKFSLTDEANNKIEGSDVKRIDDDSVNIDNVCFIIHPSRDLNLTQDGNSRLSFVVEIWQADFNRPQKMLISKEGFVNVWYHFRMFGKNTLEIKGVE